MTAQRLVGGYRLFLTALGLVGLGTLYLVLQKGTFNAGNFFSFFTIEANLLAAFTLLVTGVAALRSDRLDRLVTLRGFATLAMTLTGIIYFLLLQGLEEQLQIPVPGGECGRSPQRSWTASSCPSTVSTSTSTSRPNGEAGRRRMTAKRSIFVAGSVALTVTPLVEQAVVEAALPIEGQGTVE